MKPYPLTTSTMNKITSITEGFLNKVELEFNHSLPPVDIRLDLTGQSAGQALFSQNTCAIRYNMMLFEENPDYFFQQTIPHEVAHIACHSLYGRHIRPHGKEWKNMMVFFNVSSDRCHNLNTQNSRHKHYKTLTYNCACQSHQLTLIRHNRILKGKHYFCIKCNAKLTPD